MEKVQSKNEGGKKERRITRAEKRIINKRKWKRKQINHNYYLKRKKAEKKRRKMAGDVLGYYLIVLTKNRRRFKTLMMCRWSIKANDAYNRFVEENHAEVSFPVRSARGRILDAFTPNINKVEYEILLIKLKDENYDPDERPPIRDEDGKLLEFSVVDRERFVVIRRDEWYVEETFFVTGFNPFRERKDYRFILNNVILGDIDKGVGRRVALTPSSVSVLYDDGRFDCVFCRCADDSDRLYTKLEKDCVGKDVIFLGEPGPEVSYMIGKKYEERTGRPMSSLLHRR